MSRNSSSSSPRRQAKQVSKSDATTSMGGRRFLPPKNWLKEKAARLARFPPHRLEDLIGGALKDPKAQVTAGLIEEIRRRTGAQLAQLVEELGVDPQHPDKWQRAFHELAAIHHGVGIISWVRRPPNRNAAKKSTSDLDRRLYGYVTELQKRGKPLAAVFGIIARDPEKCRRLELSSNSRSQKPDVQMKVETIRKRWARISKRAPPGSLLAALTGDFPIFGTEGEQAEYMRIMLATMPELIPPGKSSPSKKS